jgi:hypothetical protein
MWQGTYPHDQLREELTFLHKYALEAFLRHYSHDIRKDQQRLHKDKWRYEPIS